MPDPSPPPQPRLFFPTSARATGSRGDKPLLAWSQAKQAFATCNERDLDAGRELSKAPAAAPPSPRRHCQILLDIVTRILYATSSSKIVFSWLHSGISAPWSHVVIAAVIHNDVVGRMTLPGGRRPNRERKTSPSGQVSIVILLLLTMATAFNRPRRDWNTGRGPPLLSTGDQDQPVPVSTAPLRSRAGSCRRIRSRPWSR
jgi:hypothetical protein